MNYNFPSRSISICPRAVDISQRWVITLYVILVLEFLFTFLTKTPRTFVGPPAVLENMRLYAVSLSVKRQTFIILLNTKRGQLYFTLPVRNAAREDVYPLSPIPGLEEFVSSGNWEVSLRSLSHPGARGVCQFGKLRNLTEKSLPSRG